MDNRKANEHLVTDRQMLERVARAYYELGLRQEKIAQRLDLSRVSVSRLLQRARTTGLVQVRIMALLDDYRDRSTERRLRAMYGLADAVALLDPLSDSSTLESLMAQYLDDILPLKGIVTVGGGRTVGRVGDVFATWNPRPHIEWVPMIGLSRSRDDDGPSPSMGQRWAGAGGRWRELAAPYVTHHEQVALMLAQEPDAAEILQEVRRADAAIVGIGTRAHALQRARAWKHHELVAILKQSNAVGDILFRFLDAEGRPCVPDSDRYVLGATLDDLLQIPQRIALAYGTEKSAAIHAALRGGYVNILVTTATTAHEILRHGGTPHTCEPSFTPQKGESHGH